MPDISANQSAVSSDGEEALRYTIAPHWNF